MALAKDAIGIPDFDLTKAFKRTGGYLRNYNNVYFEKYLSRD